MNPVKNKKTELYVEPEIQDITPVSVVKGQGTGEGTGGGDQEGGEQE